MDPSLSEQVETPKVLEELSRSNTARPGARTDRQKRNAAKRVALLLALLTPFVVSLLFLAYLQWTLRADLREVRAENSRLNAIIGPENDRLRQLEAILAEQSLTLADGGAGVRQLEADLNREIRQLNQTIADLQTQLAARTVLDTGAWRLAEAEYLLRVAAQRLQVEKDTGTAIELLSSAERILAEHAEEAGRAVQQAIAGELAQLRAVPRVDRESIYLKVTGLMDKLASLPLVQTGSDAFRARLPETPASPISTGDAPRGIWQSTLNLIGSVFVWRRWDEAPDVMLPPTGPGNALMAMRLLLEQAQLALIQRQEAVFRESLARCRDLLMQHVVMGSDQAQAFDLELQGLMSLVISPELPDISRSLTLLQQLRD